MKSDIRKILTLTLSFALLQVATLRLPSMLPFRSLMPTTAGYPCRRDFARWSWPTISSWAEWSGQVLKGSAAWPSPPNGDIYAKGKLGRIWALRDLDGDGRADKIEEFGPAGGGTFIAFHNGYLYHSSTTAVYRYRYVPGELVPSSPAEVIVHDLPPIIHDHDAKSFAFDDEGGMMVEVGAPYNVYADGDRLFGAKGKPEAEVTELLKTHGGFWRFDANKLNQTLADGVHFSTGHKHSLSLAWQPVSRSFFRGDDGARQFGHRRTTILRRAG